LADTKNAIVSKPEAVSSTLWVQRAIDPIMFVSCNANYVKRSVHGRGFAALNMGAIS
jgi:hypothetical protein